ncbi:MAG: YncE family protein, partial [Gemmataceae bacterium]
MPRPTLALSALLLGCAGLAVALRPAGDDAPPARRAVPVLPGIRPSGEILLPNGWSLRPAGRQIPVGDFPVNLALHPSGKFAAVLHAGFGPHEVITLDLTAGTEAVVARVPLAQAFNGLAFSPDGKTLYASGGEFEVVHAFAFDAGMLGSRRQIRVGTAKEKFIVSGLAATGRQLFVAGTWGHEVRTVDLDAPGKWAAVATGKDSYPYGVLPHGGRLLVSLWNQSAVAVIEGGEVTARWATEAHPTEMALSPDGKTLFVACANSTKVSVLDADTGKPRETINCALYPASPNGNTPSSLCLTPDGALLFVANSDANNVAAFNVSVPGKSRSLGYVPAGWYPTSVRYNAATKKLLVANGKGVTSRANPQGPGPYARSELRTVYQYIGAILQGTVGVIDLPTPEKMAEYTKQARACSPLKPDFSPRTGGWTAGNPVPPKQGDKSPIEHCIYVIK